MSSVTSTWESLHCALAAAQCIVIGPVCGFVCGSVTMITWNYVCIDLDQTAFVGKGSDHLTLFKFWPSCAPGRGSAAGRKFSASPYYSQRTVFASLWAFFFIQYCCCSNIQLNPLFILITKRYDNTLHFLLTDLLFHINAGKARSSRGKPQDC